MNWNNYPNFSPDELRCKETGELNMDPDFMDRLQGNLTRFCTHMFVSNLILAHS